MADIDVYLEQIRTAIYGEEVREAIYESIKAVDGAIKEITWEEYRALPAHIKLGETVYFITDTKQIVKRGIIYGGSDSGEPMYSVDGTTLLFNAANAPVKTFDVYLKPYQNDHGWGSVWAGGNGKNKFQVTANSAQVSGVTFTVDSFGRVTCNGTSSDSILFEVGTFDGIGNFIFNGCAKGSSTESGHRNYYLEISSTPFNQKKCYGPDVEIDNTSGDTLSVCIWIAGAEVLDNVVFTPMIRSTGNSEFKPYANICPITKRSSFHINSHGANIYNWLDPDKVTVRGYIPNPNDITEEIAAPGFGYTYYGKVQPNITYTFSGNVVDFGDAMYIYQYDVNGNILSRTSPISYDMIPYTFKTSEKTRYFGFSFSEAAYDPETIQLQIGPERTEYEPYNDHYDYIFSIGKQTWGGTYFGTKGKFIETWAEIASYNGESLPGLWYSSMENYNENRRPTIGAQVVYQISNSTEDNVNTIMFNTILGINSVWTDTDDEIYLEYMNESWEDVPRIAELRETQYNDLPQPDKNDGTIRFLTDTGKIMLNSNEYGGGGEGGSDVYTDDEVEIGTWFGRTLYQKTFYFDQLNSTYHNALTYPGELGWVKNAVVHLQSDNLWHSAPWQYWDGQNFISVHCCGNKIHIDVGPSGTYATEAYVTACYVKPTS